MITIGSTIVIVVLMSTYILGLALLSFCLQDNPEINTAYVIANNQNDANYLSKSIRKTCYDDKC